MIDLTDELAAIRRHYRAGTHRLREYARLVGRLQRLRDKASLQAVRHGFTTAIRRVCRQAGHERRRR
jgi:hypothetical protein